MKNPWALMALELRDVAETVFETPLDPKCLAAVELLAENWRINGECPVPFYGAEFPTREHEFNAVEEAACLAKRLRILMERCPDDADYVAGYKAALGLAISLRVRLDSESKETVQ